MRNRSITKELAKIPLPVTQAQMPIENIRVAEQIYLQVGANPSGQ